MPLTRREFLLGAGAATLAACSGDDGSGAGAPQATSAPPPSRPATSVPAVPPAPPLAGPPFSLGVASGDPDPTSVVLWTRLAPDPTGGGGMPDADVDVLWEVAVDDGFTDVVAAGIATAEARHGHSIHVVADGLDPGAAYHYRFRVGEHTSAAGRTRTAPDGEVGSATFAFASCQNWEDGFWPAHTHLAEEAVDLVVWLGDYVYEGGAGTDGVRAHDGPEPTTLDGYRNRYGLYKGDPALQAAHASAPWLVVWDDHEVENNYAGSSPQDGGPEDAFLTRRAAAYQAWWEHTPVRIGPPTGPALAIHRSLRWGHVLSLFALDTRQHRSDQPCGRGSDLGAGCAERDDPARTMLGAEQEAWLAAELPASSTTWNVLANQVVFTASPIPVGPATFFNLDQWDGYPAARERVLDVLAATANPVVITGDIHASAVGDVRRGDDVVATEFVGTSISSSFPPDLVELFESAATTSGARMADAARRGYVRCTVTPSSFRADYRVVDSVAAATSPVSTSSSWVVDAGAAGVREA